MQDRFKFRGITKGKVNEFVYGSLLWYAGEPQIWDKDGKNYIVKPETVQQCTGLKDKNGTLIYEGDIIKYAEFDFTDFSFKDWETEKAQVIYGNDYDTYYPAFDLKDKDFDGTNAFSYLFNEGWTIEVIGNIYENKELLNGVKKA